MAIHRPKRGAMDSRPPAGASTPTVMPLMMATKGQQVTLVEIRGGAGITHRLAEMGLIPGARLRVISRGAPGPCIVGVKDSRLMIGRGMMDRVYVSPDAV